MRIRFSDVFIALSIGAYGIDYRALFALWWSVNRGTRYAMSGGYS